MPCAVIVCGAQHVRTTMSRKTPRNNRSVGVLQQSSGLARMRVVFLFQVPKGRSKALTASVTGSFMFLSFASLGLQVMNCSPPPRKKAEFCPPTPKWPICPSIENLRRKWKGNGLTRRLTEGSQGTARRQACAYLGSNAEALSESAALTCLSTICGAMRGGGGNLISPRWQICMLYNSVIEHATPARPRYGDPARRSTSCMPSRPPWTFPSHCP